jgi:hypothetical protein
VSALAFSDIDDAVGRTNLVDKRAEALRLCGRFDDGRRNPGTGRSHACIGRRDRVLTAGGI